MKDREPAKKPVGAHFLFLMDDLPRRPHRSQSARAKYDRSLANTNLSRYHDAAHRSDTPVRGKRHFSTPRTHDFRARQEVPRCRSSHGQPVDQLWNNLEPKVEAAPIVPQRRAAPFRRSASVGAIPSEPPATARDGRPRGRRHSFDGRSNTSTSHLLCGSLMPMREAPVERPEPPPLPKSKWRPGIRMFPERQRCSSVAAPRSGLMMVKPQPHWRSVTERQQDGMTSVRPSRRSAESRSMETSPRRVGRSRSCTPAPRDFDIISGLRR